MFKKEQLWANNNKPRLSSIFKETARAEQMPHILMTLRGHDPDLPCFRDLFISLVTNDPSEASVGEVVFNDVYYWLILRETDFIKPYLEEWRKVADVKRKQKAFESIVNEVATNGKNQFAAAKYLIEEPWKPNTKASRATKKETTKEAFDPFKEDIQRMSEHLLQ